MPSRGSGRARPFARSHEYLIPGKGDLAVYRADQDLVGVFELYASRIGRGARAADPPTGFVVR